MNMETPVAPARPVAASLEPFVTADRLAGAVLLVASPAKIIALEAVGFADLSEKRPMKPDTIFWIASLTKPLTSTALMMLVEDGRLRLDDPVENYIPEFGGQKLLKADDSNPAIQPRPKHSITIRQILSHTSGLPFRSSVEWPTLDRITLKEAVESYAAETLRFEPGSQYEYSNEGTNTAGRIIEVVSGLPYDQFLNDRLLRPLEMTETVFVPTDEQVGRLAKCYGPNSTQTRLEEKSIEFLSYPLTDPARQPIPGGGLFSTARDMSRFARMILREGELDGKRFLSPRSIQEMTRRQTKPGMATSYGLGWAREEPAFGHGGALGSHLWINPQKSLITLYLTAYGGSDTTVKESHNRFIASVQAHLQTNAG